MTIWPIILIVSLSLVLAALITVLIIFLLRSTPSSQTQSSVDRQVHKYDLEAKIHKYDLAVLAIFKNEGHIVNEWLQHYVNEGVKHFYLIDNDSTDNFTIDSKFSDKITLFNRSGRYQEKHYNECVLPLKHEFRYLIVVDLDEFMFSVKGTLAEYLKEQDKDQILIPWKMFGSSGFKQQPDSVIQNFVWRWGCLKNNTERLTKGIVKGSSLKKIGIHNHTMDTHEILPVFNWKDDVSQLPIHLNHYAIQSWEYFENVKMTRGDATNEGNVRDEGYFKAFDKNNLLDEELKFKQY